MLYLPAVLVLAVYLNTMFPGVPGGDAGELLAEACHGGTPHPPGYPLFTMSMGTVMSAKDLVGCPPAVLANALCCCMGATTTYLITVSTFLMASSLSPADGLVNECAACLSSLLFSFSPLVWEYSVGAEVFALNNLLVAFVLFYSVKVGLARSDAELVSSAYAGSFFCGLSLSNQHTSVLFIFVLAPWVALELVRRKRMTVRVFALLSACFILGLSPYLYLPYSSYDVKEGSWGDITTFEGFKRHVLREEYGTLKLAPRKLDDNSESSLRRLYIWFVDFSFQVTPVFAALSLLGISVANLGRQPSKLLSGGKTSHGGAWDDSWIDDDHEGTIKQSEASLHRRAVKKNKGGTSLKKSVKSKRAREGKPSSPKGAQEVRGSTIHVALSSTLSFYLLFWNFVLSNLPLANPMAYAVHSRFWMQPNLLLCMYGGIGTMWALKSFPRLSPRVTAAVTIFFLLYLRYPSADRSDASFNSAYGKAILDSIPESSLLLSHTDLDWNTVRYMRQCEGVKPGVVHLSVQLLPYPWFRRQVESGLYGEVAFPKILPNVSTGRYEEGNKVLLSRFFEANIGKYGDNMFVDMQAISDDDLQPGGLWRGFLLVPHGLVYRVKAIPPPPVSLLSLSETHPESKLEMENIPSGELMVQPKYKLGSWEFAANSVVNDGKYQTSLHFLTLGLEVGKQLQENPNVLLPHYLSCLSFSTSTLAEMVKERRKIVEEFGARGGGSGWGWMNFGGMGGGAGVGVIANNVDLPLSYPHQDMVKNAALSAIKYMQVCEVASNLAKSGSLDERGVEMTSEHNVERAREFVRISVSEFI
ncbi:hypothetical protein TrRE_jg10714, partial [Triparma retinervis]